MKNQNNKSLLRYSGQKVISLSSSSCLSSCDGTSDSSFENDLTHKDNDKFQAMVEQA